MIHIIDKYNDPQTTLRKIKPGLWELDGRDPSGSKYDSGELNLPYPTLGRAGIESLICAIETLIKDKPLIIDGDRDTYYEIQWASNPAGMKFGGRYRPEGRLRINDKVIVHPVYHLLFPVKNKYRTHYVPQNPNDPNYDNRISDESYGCTEICTIEENLKKYIQDLKDELKRDDKGNS